MAPGAGLKQGPCSDYRWRCFDQHCRRYRAATFCRSLHFPSHLIFSICVTVNCPLVRSGTNCTLSPGLTFLSNCGSGTWKTIVIPSSIPNFLIGPCLIVIFSAVGSIFVTWPITASGDWAKVASGATPSANISVIMDRDDADVGAWCSAACDFRPVAGRGDGPGNKD